MTDSEADDAGDDAAKPLNGKPKKLRIGKLDSIGRVASELGHLYRQARRGEIETLDASRCATILGEVRKCLEIAAVEDRLRVLEERVGERRSATVTPLRAVS